jgi:RNA polymerase sigma factor (sigma-70 family)
MSAPPDPPVDKARTTCSRIRRCECFSGSDGVMTEAQVAQFSGADQDYAEQFDDLWQRAYLVAYRVLGSSAASEDVAQEALARAYSWWSRISTSSQGWVAKVAYGLAIDQVRRQQTARKYVQTVSEHEPDPKTEDRMDLMNAIERLPRRQRQVVVLRYLADQSEADTAHALGLRVTTVRRHAARGLSTLGGHLVSPVQEG